MKNTKAFAPGNLSCIFVICPNKDPKKMGSLGLGIAVEKGVIVSVSKSKKTIITVNNKPIKFPTVLSVIDSLAKDPVKVNIKYGFPYGCGFGMSGGAALATSYALNKLLGLKKTNNQLAMIAHTAEVKNKTGLGDVGGEFNGHVCAKYKIGNPLKGKRIKIKEKYIYYKIFSKLDTKKVITNNIIKKKINKAGLKALKEIKKLKNPQLKKIIKISKTFSSESTLLRDKKVKDMIKKIEKNKNSASMVMLGNAVYSNKPFKGSKKIGISKRGAHLL